MIVFSASIEITYPLRAWTRIKVNFASPPPPSLSASVSVLYNSLFIYLSTILQTQYVSCWWWDRANISWNVISDEILLLLPFVLNPFIGGRARALYLVILARAAELNLLVGNVMENGYANIAEFSSVAPLPCTLRNALSLSSKGRKRARTKIIQEEIRTKLLWRKFNLKVLSPFPLVPPEFPFSN